MQKILLVLFTAVRCLRLWLDDLRAGQGELGWITLRAWWQGWLGRERQAADQ
jgi:hypothetical protein